MGIVVDANVDHVFVAQNINSTWLEADDVAIGYPSEHTGPQNRQASSNESLEQ